MLNRGEAESIRESYALRLWSAKQIHTRAAYRLWYLKHVLRGEPELRLVPALCDRRCLTLDVGANRGMYSAAALRFSSGVIAFEPQSHLAAVMRKCLPPEVQIMECAVSHSAGSANLLVPKDPRYHAEARVLGWNDLTAAENAQCLTKSVPTVSLDDVVDRPVGLIKIDVEGHEMAVLGGATRIIGASRPNVIIELEDRHQSGAVDLAWEWFEAMSYEGFCLNEGRLVRVRPEGVRRSSADSLYVYNFIFLPIERTRKPRPSLRAALSAVLAL